MEIANATQVHNPLTFPVFNCLSGCSESNQYVEYVCCFMINYLVTDHGALSLINDNLTSRLYSKSQSLKVSRAVLLSASAQARIVALAMTELKEPGKNRFRLSVSHVAQNNTGFGAF